MSIKKIVFGLAAIVLLFGLSGSASAQTADIAALLQQIALLQSQIAALSGTPAAGACTFTKNLTIGSQGDDVKCLQNYLIAGDYSIPAGATGYFGPQTQSAVIAWQKANAVSPASGVFGPLSRAAYNDMTAVVTPPDSGPGTGALCPAGMVTSVPSAANNWAACVAPPPVQGNCPAGMVTSVPSAANNWAACVTAPPVQGNCPAGMVTSVPSAANNWAACVAGGTTPPVTGTEGSITTKLAAQPVPNADIRTTDNVPVYGIEVTAIGSDMTVDRVDLQVSVTPTGGSASNPGSFINKIAFYDGSTLLKEMAVSSSNFTKDSSDRYHAIISGLGFKVLNGAKKDLTVKFSVNSLNTTDANRAVVVSGYAGNSNNIRATDTVGLQSYTDMSGTANQRSHTFKPAGSSTLTVTIDSTGTPKANNTRLSSSGISKMTMLAFNARATDGDAKLTKMYVQINATATPGLPDTLYLTDESGTVLGTSDSSSVTNGNQSGFTGLSIPIAKDTTKKFFIKADQPSTATGQAASTTIPVNGVQWEKPDGSTASTTPSSALASNDQYLWGAVPKYSLYGTPTVSKSVDSGSTLSTTTLNFELKVKVEADGGALIKPVYTSATVRDFTIGFASTSRTTYTADSNLILGVPGSATSSLTMTDISPTDATVGDGGSYIMTFVGTMINRTAAGVLTPADGRPSPYFMVLATASSTVGGGAITGQTWGIEGIKTPSGSLD